MRKLIKFNPGDKVIMSIGKIVINATILKQIVDNKNLHTFKYSYIGKKEFNDNDEIYLVELDGGKEKVLANIDSIRLYKEPKFNIGDDIVITDGEYKGYTGSIFEFYDNNTYRVTVKRLHGEVSVNLPEDYLELYTIKTPTIPKFNIGHHVEITKGQYKYISGYISEVHGNLYKIEVGTQTLELQEDELKLYDKKDKRQFWEKQAQDEWEDQEHKSYDIDDLEKEFQDRLYAKPKFNRGDKIIINKYCTYLNIKGTILNCFINKTPKELNKLAHKSILQVNSKLPAYFVELDTEELSKRIGVSINDFEYFDNKFIFGEEMMELLITPSLKALEDAARFQKGDKVILHGVRAMSSIHCDLWPKGTLIDIEPESKYEIIDREFGKTKCIYHVKSLNYSNIIVYAEENQLSEIKEKDQLDVDDIVKVGSNQGIIKGYRNNKYYVTFPEIPCKPVGRPEYSEWHTREELTYVQKQ